MRQRSLHLRKKDDKNPVPEIFVPLVNKYSYIHIIQCVGMYLSAALKKNVFHLRKVVKVFLEQNWFFLKILPNCGEGTSCYFRDL